MLVNDDVNKVVMFATAMGFIIGKVLRDDEDHFLIENPLQIIQQSQEQMGYLPAFGQFRMDASTGEMEVKNVKLYKANIISSFVPPKSEVDFYEQQVSGTTPAPEIFVPDNKIII